MLLNLIKHKCFSVVVLMSIALPALAAESLWQSDVKGSFILNPTGGPVIVGEDKLTALDALSGKVLWERNKKEMFFLPGTQFGVYHQSQNFELFDFKTGKTIWSISKDKPMGGLEGFYAYVPVIERNVILLFGFDLMVGSSMMAVEMSSGKSLWTLKNVFLKDSEKTFNCPANPGNKCDVSVNIFPPSLSLSESSTVAFDVLQPPVIDDDGVVLFLNARGPIKINIKDGSVIWRSSVSGNPNWLLHDGAPMFSYKGALIVPIDKNVFGIDLNSGKELWKYALSLKQGNWMSGSVLSPPIRFMDVVGDKLVVYGAEHPKDNGKMLMKRVGAFDDTILVDQLDPLTGKSENETPWIIADKGDTHNRYNVFISSKDKAVYMLNADSLLRVDLSDGKKVELAKVKLDGMAPDNFEMSEGNFLVSSPDAMMALDNTGKTIYSGQFPAPQLSAKEGAIGFVTEIFKEAALRDIKQAMYRNIENRSRSNNRSAKNNRANAIAGFEKAGQDASNAADASFDKLGNNVVQAQSGLGYLYFYTPGKTGGINELVQVRKSDGVITKRTPVAADVNVSYLTDPVMNEVYTRQSDKNVHAYKMQ